MIMKLNEVITQTTYNDAITATFGFSDIYETPSWISDPITRWYQLNQYEAAINDNSEIMSFKLVATLAKYRDRIMVKYNQYQTLIKTLENPSLTSKTTSDNSLTSNAKSTTSNTGNSTVSNKYSEGMGGGDASNQAGNFRYANDNTTSSETSNSTNTGESTESNNLNSTTTTTDAYMSLEGLKHEISTIFTSLFEDLTLTLLINIW